MASLKETKRRISSVKNTEKITGAMQLVAASKYARALQKKNAAARYLCYQESMLRRCLEEAGEGALASFCEPSSFTQHTQQDTPSDILVVMTSDRGLCGALNAQLIKKAESELVAHQGPMDMRLWGKKSWILARSEKVSLPQADNTVAHSENETSFASNSKRQVVQQETLGTMAAEGAVFSAVQEMLQVFQSGSVAQVKYVYPVFENVLVQKPVSKILLPLCLQPRREKEASEYYGQDKSMEGVGYGYGVKLLSEPEPLQLAQMLAASLIETQMLYAFLEMQVCEHAARMTAMDNATKNASEVIKQLTLEYNRVRQAAITTELVEITSGAEAL